MYIEFHLFLQLDTPLLTENAVGVVNSYGMVDCTEHRSLSLSDRQSACCIVLLHTVRTLPIFYLLAAQFHKPKPPRLNENPFYNV